MAPPIDMYSTRGPKPANSLRGVTKATGISTFCPVKWCEVHCTVCVYVNALVNNSTSTDQWVLWPIHAYALNWKYMRERTPRTLSRRKRVSTPPTGYRLRVHSASVGKPQIFKLIIIYFIIHNSLNVQIMFGAQLVSSRLTFASIIRVLATSRGVVTAAAMAPAARKLCPVYYCVWKQ